ncbi:MAG: hypothetical protein ACYC19_10365 [Acidimicrobiales bacterium]
MPENIESPSEKKPRFGRTRRPSAVPREMVMGIDELERKASFVAGALAVILAGVLSPHLFKNTTVIDKLAPGKSNTCTAGYHLVGSMCEKVTITTPSDWLIQFLEILIIGAFILFFALRRKRAGVAVASLLLGLALGSVGVGFLFFGGWLIVRALRLQKYGEASFFASSRKAREMGQAKREARGTATRTRGAKTPVPVSANTPAPSKRYTPKKRAGRR